MKRFWLILGIVAVAGVVLMGAGLALGMVPNLLVDRDGVHVGDAHRQQFSSGDLGGITGLDIKVGSSRVEIIPTEQTGASLNVDCERNLPVTWSVENGVLRVRQGFDFLGAVFSFNFGIREDIIQVYVPRNLELDRVKIEGSSGSLNVSGLNCRSFDASISSGKMNISRVSADEFRGHTTSGACVLDDCRGDAMNLSLTSGKIEMSEIDAGLLRLSASSGTVRGSGVKAQGLSARTTSGSVRLAGELKGDSTIEVASGTCIVETTGSQKDYSRYVSVNSGTVTVNGTKVHGNDTDAAAPHSVRVKVTSGTARLVFLDD
ncbi:MAG: DUF4097 domain-containing protein [Gracilibacteraceae bacterium]|jgi:DUF4097 and DUF4098 domain-containing protein YvlB|nr:DUF4097 domain-containing protein [Gracilibacteraceae bacterium]